MKRFVEYYSIGDRFQAFIISRDGLSVVRDLTTTTDVRTCSEGTHIPAVQVSFEPGLRADARAAIAAARSSITFANCIASSSNRSKTRLHARSLIIVPHQLLHYVPFHALYDGTNIWSILTILRGRPVSRF